MIEMGGEGRTSRVTRPRRTSFAIDHGIGSVVVIFMALRMWNSSVKRSSTNTCIPVDRSILNKLTPITCHHGGVPLLFFAPCTPPVRVGRAGAPWIFRPTAKLGMMVSKRRKKAAGSMKKRVRTARVPITSTRSCDCVRTRVDQVM